MSIGKSEEIASLIVSHISRDVILAIEEALIVGAKRAFNRCNGIHDGHITSALGQMRHFEMNQAFFSTLETHNICSTYLRGNEIVVGKSGMLNIARFTANDDKWNSARRSQARKKLAKCNVQLETLVYPDLFADQHIEPSSGTIFFVTCFSGSMENSPDKPIRVQVAVCDSDMKQWLFIEDISKFVDRYIVTSTCDANNTVEDLVKPKLKKHIKRGTNNE